MRTLPSRSGHGTGHDYNQDDSAATSLLSSRDDLDPGHHRHAHHRSRSSGSESSWTDTGDIGEQLADDDDDPVRLQLSNEVEQELLAGVQRRHPKSHPHNQKRVRIQASSPRRRQLSHSQEKPIDKEAIEIPDFTPLPPSRALRCIGAIMSGRTGSIHGLTGKALM